MFKWIGVYTVLSSKAKEYNVVIRNIMLTFISVVLFCVMFYFKMLVRFDKRRTCSAKVTWRELLKCGGLIE
jgi:preprotein translocase subunit YajC